VSRRNRLWHVAREAKTAQAFTDPEDRDDDGPELRDDDPRCYVCGARESSTDSGCCGVDGEQCECPRW
jgi:hypothetical protein